MGSAPDAWPVFGLLTSRRAQLASFVWKRMRLPVLALLAALLLAGLARPASAVEEIKPPFKLHWGETTDRMERLLTGAKLRIVDRRNVDGREVWDVEGIVQEGLRRT